LGKLDVFCMLEILQSQRFRNSPETKDTGNIFMLISIRSFLLSVCLLISNESVGVTLLENFEFLVFSLSETSKLITWHRAANNSHLLLLFKGEDGLFVIGWEVSRERIKEFWLLEANSNFPTNSGPKISYPLYLCFHGKLKSQNYVARLVSLSSPRHTYSAQTAVCILRTVKWFKSAMVGRHCVIELVPSHGEIQ